MEKYSFSYETSNSGLAEVSITIENDLESVSLINTLSFGAYERGLNAMQAEAIENAIELLSSHLAKVKAQIGSD